MRIRHRSVVILALTFLSAVVLPFRDLSADESLREVQKKLSALGFYKGKIDGAPGSMTNAAIRRFQVAKNLKVTGDINSQTLTSLGLDCKSPAPDYSSTGRFFKGGPLAHAESNSQVEAIRKIQKILAAGGFFVGPQNGLPSATLVAALKDWQIASGLSQTGCIDSQSALKMGIVSVRR